MLSNRGRQTTATVDVPWRFAPGTSNSYNKVTSPTGMISFGSASNNLVHVEVAEFVAKNVKFPPEVFAYSFSNAANTRFPAAMASHMNEYFKPHSPIEKEHIITGSGLTPIHELTALAIGDPGDGVLVSRPIYGRLQLDFGNVAGMEVVYADMHGTDPFEIGVVERYEAALKKANDRGVKIVAVMIVNPHNPLGRCYPEETLRALMDFCQRHSIHLISDEIYALSVYDTDAIDAPTFTSVLSINPKNLIDTDKLHVFYGMSKNFGCAGIRLGCIITQNSLLRKAILANIRFGSPSGAAIAIGTAILEDRAFVASFIKMSREKLCDSRAYTSRILDEAGIKYAKGGNAGFFVYIDLSPWLPVDAQEGEHERDYALAQKLLDGGVGLHPCEEHSEEPGRFRLVFTHERDYLAEGLKRLISILGPLAPSSVPA